MIIPFAADHNPPQKGLQKLLVPISVSICTNIPNYENPKFIISRESPSRLCDALLDYLTLTGSAASEIMQAKFRQTLDGLAGKLSDYEERLSHEIDETDEINCKIRRLQNLTTRLLTWLKQTVVLGFNSGKFDMNLVREHLFPCFHRRSVQVHHIIKKKNNYLSISTDLWLFLDIRNYLAANVSYRDWIKSYGIPDGKLHFPYEFLDCPEKLDYPKLPPKEAFWSTLKQEGISDADYSALKDIWDQNGFRNLGDLLEHYNNADTKPFIQATEKMMKQWFELEIDPFKSGAISLPGLALKRLVNHLPPHTVLPLIPHKFRDIFYLIQDNVVGGLSTVMHRYHEVGVTRLPNGDLCRHLSSRDANGLYLASLADDETGTGVFGVWRPTVSDSPALSIRTYRDMDEDDKLLWDEQRNRNMEVVFHRQLAYEFGHKELQWLEWMSEQMGQRVQHKFNGGQKVVQRSNNISYPVDGYIKSCKTILQFHGCHWHGHGCALDQGRFAERRGQTAEVTRYLRSVGFTVIEAWECEWDKEVKNNVELRSFLDLEVNLPIKKTKLTGFALLEKIKDGSAFGLLQCDVEVPQFKTSLVEKFAEYPPIFKNVEISRNDIGPFMQAYAVANDMLTKPRRSLNSYFGEKVLISSSLAKWYLENGLVITRIYQFIQMKPKLCFKHLGEELTQKRREADRTGQKVVGQLWKDIGNNYYGKTFTNKSRHKNVVLAEEREASLMVNNKRFCELEYVGSTSYEVVMDKRIINQDLPITVAAFVYMNSKLRMLRFVHDFLGYYLRPLSYQLIASDTDSILMACSDQIDALVRQDRMEEYNNGGKAKYLVTDEFSARALGLFKIEFEEDGCIALCPKTYYFWNSQTAKISCKGLSKQTNKFIRQHFLDVLLTRLRGAGTNYGIKKHGKNLYQYSQQRFGLSYLFITRIVLEDGISTNPPTL